MDERNRSQQERMISQQEERTKSLHAIERMKELQGEMRAVDRREIGGKSDIELTIWQTSYPSESPQYRLAEYEWNRRLTVAQVKAARWAAIVGLAGVIIGALLTKMLEKF